METHDQPVGGGGGGEAAGGDSRYRIRDTGDELNAEQREALRLAKDSKRHV